MGFGYMVIIACIFIVKISKATVNQHMEYPCYFVFNCYRYQWHDCDYFMTPGLKFMHVFREWLDIDFIANIYIYVTEISGLKLFVEGDLSWLFTSASHHIPSFLVLGRYPMYNKQRVLMHGHQGWNVRHGLCHIYMIYVYIWVVHSFCLFCCLFIIVTTQFVALYEPCKPKPKPKPKPSTYDTRTTTPWQRSKFRYLDRSQSNKYAINMQIQTISVSK